MDDLSWRDGNDNPPRVPPPSHAVRKSYHSDDDSFSSEGDFSDEEADYSMNRSSNSHSNTAPLSLPMHHAMPGRHKNHENQSLHTNTTVSSDHSSSGGYSRGNDEKVYPAPAPFPRRQVSQRSMALGAVPEQPTPQGPDELIGLASRRHQQPDRPQEPLRASIGESPKRRLSRAELRNLPPPPPPAMPPPPIFAQSRSEPMGYASAAAAPPPLRQYQSDLVDPMKSVDHKGKFRHSGNMERAPPPQLRSTPTPPHIHDMHDHHMKRAKLRANAGRSSQGSGGPEEARVGAFAASNNVPELSQNKPPRMPAHVQDLHDQHMKRAKLRARASRSNPNDVGPEGVRSGAFSASTVSDDPSSHFEDMVSRYDDSSSSMSMSIGGGPITAASSNNPQRGLRKSRADAKSKHHGPRATHAGAVPHYQHTPMTLATATLQDSFSTLGGHSAGAAGMPALHRSGTTDSGIQRGLRRSHQELEAKRRARGSHVEEGATKNSTAPPKQVPWWLRDPADPLGANSGNMRQSSDEGNAVLVGSRDPSDSSLLERGYSGNQPMLSNPAPIDNSGLVVANPVAEDDEAYNFENAHQIDLEELELEEARREKMKRESCQKLACMFCCITLFIIVITLIILSATGSFSKDPPEIIEATPPPFKNATRPPTPSPTQAPTQYSVVLRAELNLPNATLDKIDANSASAQYSAFDWLESNRGLYDGLLPWQKQQLFALLTFYFDFSGPKWPKVVGKTWLEEKDVCRWYSAEYGAFDEDGGFLEFAKLNTNIQQATARNSCTFDGQFQALVMAQLPLEEEVPQIPAEISLLTHLSALSLPHNKVNRSLVDLLPPEIYEMEKLDYINFWNNFLSGPLPSGFGSLTKLDTIGLRDNQLTGSIPASWSKLTDMTDLDVANNRLTDSLPRFFSTLGSMTKLTSLNAFSNSFEGPLPPEIGLLTSLENLDLRRTAGLNGTIPSEIGLLTSLGRLNLYRNAVSLVKFQVKLVCLQAWKGSILRILNFLALTNQTATAADSGVNIGGNALSGSIPKEIGQLVGLQYLFLGGNTGVSGGGLPSEFGMLTSLVKLVVSGSSLRGSLPSELVLLTGLTALELSECALTGDIPSEIALMAGVKTLDLSANALVGSIPSEIGLMENLVGLMLHNNSLSGSIPKNLVGEDARLSLENNPQLSGVVPETVCALGQYNSTGDDKTGLSFDCVAGALCGCEWCRCDSLF
ncbi:LRR receptor-like serine threonine-protein kinase [Seminavis robusta]|uniref:LRR receptor-like serine threonine-protein kinase n=1 Tax=Seminavis robusta TaxID=568900 RepID=A0A9N8F0I8_9STRA|nr:LRR receptor-like serine threonine-protein kinase [Seminavis robusta]|eukprot:Sro2609_g332490.1 LRR receptor-like serine threonine-protein kinase (1212) ;mRNA; f:5446-9741